MNYPRRQEYRRLSRAAATAAAAGVLALMGLSAAGAGNAFVAAVLLVLACCLGMYARHWFSLARRSEVGARSEDEVRRELAPLEAEGWRFRHSLRWRGGGDIDSVAFAPTGLVVAIETKTRVYDATAS